MRETITTYGKEYAYRLFGEQDFALWGFMLFTYLILALLMMVVLTKHQGSIPDQELQELGRLLIWPFYIGVGIVFGRPLLLMAVEHVVVPRWRGRDGGT